MSENSSRLATTRSRGANAADQVSAILAAAEESARRMLEHTEQRVRDRIAEGERAGQNRVRAAEEEAAEILAAARAEGQRTVSEATSEALAILARAQESADTVLTEARGSAIEQRDQAQARSRELLSDARAAAGGVREEGMEMVSNLREMGDSLRANSERLLRDIQSIHSQMVSKLDRVDRSAAPAPRLRASRGPNRLPDPVSREDGEVLDVPEFIPPA